MTAKHSIQSALQQAYTQLKDVSESAWLDAEVLLCHCLNKPRSYLKAWPETMLDSDINTHYQNLIAQRLQHKPIAYLTGTREFWSRPFKVTEDVLIPRPDTELLIEISLPLIPQKDCRILDLGTGSGIIAITLGLERPQATLIATDKSEAALQVAKENADHLGANNIQFRVSDWFSQLTTETFDFILSNPPYINMRDKHLLQGDVQHEPKTALVAAQQGLADILAIVQQAPQHLNPGGHLLIEHGYDQQAAVQHIFSQAGFSTIQTHIDLAGNPRITSGLWNLS